MTSEYPISADDIADMDRYKDEILPAGSETLTKDDARPVVVAFEPDPVEGEWSDDHPFVAEFPSTEAARGWQHDETFNAEALERLRDAVFDEHTVFFASEFDAEDFEVARSTGHHSMRRTLIHDDTQPQHPMAHTTISTRDRW